MFLSLPIHEKHFVRLRIEAIVANKGKNVLFIFFTYFIPLNCLLSFSVCLPSALRYAFIFVMLLFPSYLKGTSITLNNFFISFPFTLTVRNCINLTVRNEKSCTSYKLGQKRFLLLSIVLSLKCYAQESG